MIQTQLWKPMQHRLHWTY